jgi:predicted HicB family RNase H-like nuclease
MIKNKRKDMPVIFIRIEPNYKEKLSSEAQKQGLQLSTYCRMVLINSVNEAK